MYSALLVAPDGDWQVDYMCDTVEEVEAKLANQGSKWYFYPFHAVIKWQPFLWDGNKRIISAAPPFEDMRGKSIRTFTKLIAATPDAELEAGLR